MKNRDNEMAELTSEVSDLIPISEKLKEENECLKTEVAEGNQERIDMLGKIFKKPRTKNHYVFEGHIDAESKRVESLKKQITELTSQIEESKKKENKTNNENNVLRESIGTGVGDFYSSALDIFLTRNTLTQLFLC